MHSAARPTTCSGLIDRGMAGSTEEALVYFPQPYRPLLEADRLAEVDNLTIREKLEQLEPAARGVRRCRRDVGDQLQRPDRGRRLRPGVAVVRPRRRQLAADVRGLRHVQDRGRYPRSDRGDGRGRRAWRSAPVRGSPRSPRTARGPPSTLEDGTALTAAAVVVTLPLNVLDSVTFDPPLSEGKRRAAHRGQASQGVKVWARLRGEYEPFVALAPGSAPLTLCQVGVRGERRDRRRRVRLRQRPTGRHRSCRRPGGTALLAAGRRGPRGGQPRLGGRRVRRRDMADAARRPAHRIARRAAAPGGLGVPRGLRLRQRVGRVHRRRHRERHAERPATCTTSCRPSTKSTLPEQPLSSPDPDQPEEESP